MSRRLKTTILLLPLLALTGVTPHPVEADDRKGQPPIERMLGEVLNYDISFLWFKRMATGTISLKTGPEPGQYTAVLQAKTRGFAAFLTRNRVERIETLMELNPDGSFRPLLQKAYTTKSSGGVKEERVRSYLFDYQQRLVHYANRRTGKAVYEKSYQMETAGPIYDLLSAFYNVRAGTFGPVGDWQRLALPTFSRRGTDDIVVARIVEEEQKRYTFFPEQAVLCKVLVDSDIFKTRNGDILVGFDEDMIPQKVVVENVIALGDVRGTLRKTDRDFQERSAQK